MKRRGGRAIRAWEGITEEDAACKLGNGFDRVKRDTEGGGDVSAFGRDESEGS